MKMDKDLHSKMLGLHEHCSFKFYDYTDYHKVIFDGLENVEYFEFIDYAMWLTTMGLIETLMIEEDRRRGL